jgi:predicted nucleotidyltransferase
MRAVNNKKKLLEICKNNDIIFLAIFGSFVKGDFTKKSDTRQIFCSGEHKRLSA